MLVLVTYDVSVTTREGRRRLRNIAKICLDYGMRVQNSVFECEVTPPQLADFKASLLNTYNAKEDSLRFYQLGKSGNKKVQHFGIKPVPNILDSPLIV